MRRIVIWLLAAAAVVWTWSKLSGGGTPAGAEHSTLDLAALSSAQRAPIGSGGDDVGTPTPTAASTSADGKAAAVVPAAAAPGSEAATGAPAGDSEVERAFAALVGAVQAGDPAARDQATRLLQRQDLDEGLRARLCALLTPATSPRVPVSAAVPPKDFDAALAQLGTNNAFLHSAEGLAVAVQAMEFLRAMDDAKAVVAGTALLERCMRGSIERADKDAIACVDKIYGEHRARADRVLCDPANVARARSYSVKKGDSLAAIAARFRKEGIAIDETSLAILNRIHNMNAIRVGQQLRVPTDPIRAVVEKRSFLMAIYLGDQMLRLYWVGHGADGKTPVATFTVVEKLMNPDWDAPDGRRIPFGSPENILGKYFLKFDHPSYSGFGAHGTPMPETIGTMSSAGCIRMLDADIEELFRLLPRRATVEVRDSH